MATASLLLLLRQVSETLDELHIPYAVVGSFASSVWGEPRLTRDIDLVVDLRPQQVDPFCRAFPEPTYYLSQSAVFAAVRDGGQFNLIVPTQGLKVDFMVAGRKSWAIAQLTRRRQVPLFADREVCVASPEDVILGKLVYYREGGSDKHLRDITGILCASSDSMDRAYIAEVAAQLGVADTWRMILERIDVESPD